MLTQGVVLGFLQHLARLLNRPPPTTLTSTVKLMIQLSGGMPRYISQGLHALGEHSSRPETLFEGCTRERDGLETQEFLQVWKEELRVRSEYAKYEDARAKEVLVTALAASILGKQVRRSDPVVPGGCRWWELEWSGATALTAGRFCKTDNPGLVDGDVKLCPLLVESLVRMYANSWRVRWSPGLSWSGWENKEISYVLSVLLRLFLLREAYGKVSFGIEEMVPRGAFVPNELKALLFQLKHVTRMYEVDRHHHQDTSLEQIMRQGASGVLGPGNFAADWYVFLDTVTILGQSKVSQLSDNVTIRVIIDSFEKDVGKFFDLPTVSRDGMQRLQEAQLREENDPVRWHNVLRKRGRPQQPKETFAVLSDKLPIWLQKLPVVYFFCSPKPLNAKTLAALELLRNDHCWARHIVVLHEQESVTRNDPLAVLSQIRSL